MCRRPFGKSQAATKGNVLNRRVSDVKKHADEIIRPGTADLDFTLDLVVTRNRRIGRIGQARAAGMELGVKLFLVLESL
jgi:hypothetical protein